MGLGLLIHHVGHPWIVPPHTIGHTIVSLDRTPPHVFLQLCAQGLGLLVWSSHRIERVRSSGKVSSLDLFDRRSALFVLFICYL